MSNERRDQRDDVERRTFPVTEARVQRDEDGNPEEIATDVAVFDRLSEDLGGFVERIEPGALEFAEDVTSEFNHNPDWVLGRTSAGTLTIEETDEAVTFIATPPNTSYARDLAENIDVGNVQGGSFTFRVPEDGDDFIPRDGEPDLRIITRATVFEGGPVTHPAYPDTHTELRDTSEAERRYRQWRESREEEPEEPAETITVRLDVDDSVLREKLAELHRLAETIYGRLPENRQSRPDFDGTEDVEPAWADGAWGRPDLSDHPEAGEDDWDDLDEDARESIAGRFIVGTAGAETYVDLAYPVVNPATDNLNRNGLLAARQRASAEDDSEVAGIADALWGDFYADEDEENSADVDDRLRLARLEVAEMDAEMAGSSG